MFQYCTTVNLRDTDAFGLIYFTEQLNYCSEAFQAFLRERGAAMSADANPFVLPVVHCESDFIAPLNLNDRVRVTIDSIKTGSSSITVHYSLFKSEQTVGSALLTHVCVDPATGQSTPLPENFKELIA